MLTTAFIHGLNSSFFASNPNRLTLYPRRPRTNLFTSSHLLKRQARWTGQRFRNSPTCKADDNVSDVDYETLPDDDDVSFSNGKPDFSVPKRRRTSSSASQAKEKAMRRFIDKQMQSSRERQPKKDIEKDRDDIGDDDMEGFSVLDDDNSGLDREEENTDIDEPDDVCYGDFLYSPSLVEHSEQRRAGKIPKTQMLDSQWSDTWALAVSDRKGFEMKNQYSRVNILMEHNFTDFSVSAGCIDRFRKATIEEVAMEKARLVYEGTGLPCISEVTDMSIDAPESGSRINKSLQQGYYTRDVTGEADIMLDRVRPISDENRMVRFRSIAAYYDGENQLVVSKNVSIAMAFCTASKAVIAASGALDEMYMEVSKKFGLTLTSSDGTEAWGTSPTSTGKKGKVMIGATLLRERILRDGKVLGDGIIKVSSFLNHMVDTDLIEVCGEELAERMRHTIPNKILTVESTGLIIGLPTAKRLGIPLVFARKSRPITISDSYQTTYRSSTKGSTSELIVSCEYLESGDRVLIIDDFLAGGSTVEGLFKLVKMAHAKVVGVGVLIEKLSDGGRTFLSGYDVPVESLAKVSAEDGSISVVEEKPWTAPDSKLDEERIREEALRKTAKYYSREEEDAVTAVDEDSVVGIRRMDSVNELDEDDEDEEAEGDGVNIIRWEDDDVLDEIEDGLVRRG